LEAVVHLEKAVAMNPQTGSGWEILAAAHAKLGKTEAAQSSYSEAVRLQGDNLRMASTYAQFLYNTGETNRAIEILQKSQSPTGPQSQIARKLFVYMLVREKRYLEAVSAFQQPFELRDGDPEYGTSIAAAVAAVKAAAGQGSGAEDLSTDEQAKLRRSGLEWIRHSLMAWRARQPHTRSVLSEIANAVDTGQLASVRWADQLNQLPEEDRQEWGRFWVNYDEAQQQLSYVDPRLIDLSEWTVLEPTKIESDAGATFERLSDGSLRVSGPLAMRDVYSIQMSMDPRNINAIRLDTIADERLPGEGPGRHFTGNFHLAEIEFEVPDDSVSTGNRLITFARSWATYSWKDRPVKNAIDANRNSVWHIWGRHGNSQSAVFYLAEPVQTASAPSFTIRLIQGGENLEATLGRFRLSIQRAPTTERNADQGVESGEVKN